MVSHMMAVSDYGKFVMDLYQEDFYLSDVGIICRVCHVGIFAVFAYIMIWIRSFTLTLPEEYYYLKYYLWFLLITSLTSETVYPYGYLISTVFALYIFFRIELVCNASTLIIPIDLVLTDL